MTSVTGGLGHGHPEVTRNDKWEHDKYVWPGGLELFIYDDGRVKVGRYDAAIVVEMVHSYPPGKSDRANAWVQVRFAEA
jgi:hypothetical protein